MLAIPGAITPHPLASNNRASSSPGSNLNELGPDAFITLLTTQLQTQDPLNPMDPNQMVSELTSMNTLQEIIQIRQDMDSLLTSTQGSTSGTPNNQSNATHAAPTALGALTITPAVATSKTSANAMAAGLAALMNSLAPPTVSANHPQSNSKSQIF
jgi:flagellar basal-body rod modification protein FlgD